jgi:hypothetical protein
MYGLGSEREHTTQQCIVLTRPTNFTTRTIVGKMRNPTGSQPRRSIDGGRKSLSNSEYQRSLERIIQRDYFPDAELESPETDDTADTHSLVLLRSSEDDSQRTQCGPDTLTSFHAVTTSCETEQWKQQQERDARLREQRQVSIYASQQPLPALRNCSPPDQDYDSSDSHDANEISRRQEDHCPPRHYTELRNALFFPPHTNTLSEECAAPSFSRLETAAPDHVPPRSPAAALHVVAAAPCTDQRIIDTTATRFPRPVAQQRRQSSHHWEGEDETNHDDNDDDDVSTDLDSTVAVSIRSEIRRAAAKAQYRAARTRATVPPSLSSATDPESLQYRFPPISPRMALNRINASTAGAATISTTFNTMGPPKPRSAATTTPRKRARTSSISKMATTAPSVRSSGSFAFSLRQAYSKPMAVKVSTPKRARER